MSIIEYLYSYLILLWLIVAAVFVLKFEVIFFKILIGVVKICCFLFSEIKHLQHGKKCFMENFYKQC